MPNRRRSSAQRAAPKLFRCTGYGNCDMVFTRSEHLARHERKHTGEKPYKCVVPGCGRMFSRFDNMMQHTQTHEKTKKNTSSNNNNHKRISIVHGHRVQQQQQQQQQQQHALTPIKTEPWSSEDALKQSIPDLAMATSMVNSRTLPLPTRRASFSSFNSDPYPPTTLPLSTSNSTNTYRLSYPTTTNTSPSSPFPYHYNNDYAYNTNSNNIPRNRSSWPIRREAYYQSQHYYSNSPTGYYPPIQHNSNYDSDDYYDSIRRRSSMSTISSDSNLTSPVTTSFSFNQQHQEPTVVKRRISIDDLRLPIENLRNIQLEEQEDNKYYEYYSNSPKSKDTVDITPAEYEALQGFSKFHSKSVIARDDDSTTESTPSPILRSNSPNIAAQVCAMRQRVLMTQNESFQRR